MKPIYKLIGGFNWSIEIDFHARAQLHLQQDRLL